MRRSTLKRRPRPAYSKVSPELWAEVVERDARILMWALSEDRIHHGVSFERWWARRRLICFAAVRLGPAESAKCSNVQQVDHVWLTGSRKGKRAPSRLDHLVAMCSYHNVDSPPNRDLRQAERDYLLSMYPEATDDA